MIASAEWVGPADYMIVEFLAEHRTRIAAPPATISLNTGLSGGHTTKRVNLLADAGLVNESKKNGYYQVSDSGLRWIHGEMEDGELESLDPR